MRNLAFTRLCNTAKLDGELRAVLGAKLIGVRVTDQTYVELSDTATPADDVSVNGLVMGHDPAPAPPDPITLSPLDSLTPAQADAWIVANVTDLQSARQALRYLVRIIARSRVNG